MFTEYMPGFRQGWVKGGQKIYDVYESDDVVV